MTGSILDRDCGLLVSPNSGRSERFRDGVRSGLLEVRAQPDAFLALRDALVRLQAQLAAASTANANQDGMNAIADTLNAVLRYVEPTADSEDQLAHFGWSGRCAPAALQPPGQCRMLEALRPGAGWVFLDWKEPSDGGRPSIYAYPYTQLISHKLLAYVRRP